MRRKHRDIPCILCHVPADAALSFIALAKITIKTHRIGKKEKPLSDSRN
jgi:hypothetical protein